VKFLVDTNIILEVLLGQQREEEVKEFFREFGDSEFYITDFPRF
jgi:predicted nucleic acid-binding protein